MVLDKTSLFLINDSKNKKIYLKRKIESNLIKIFASLLKSYQIF